MNMRFWSYSRYRNLWSFFFINFVLLHHRLNLAWRSRCRHYLNLEPRWSGCVVCYPLQFYSCLLMIMICRVFNELTEAEDFLSCQPDKWRPTMEGLQRVWTAWKAMLPKFENLHCSPTLHCSLKSWPKQRAHRLLHQIWISETQFIYSINHLLTAYFFFISRK